MKLSENRPKWLDRCDWCNWPLDPEGVMCKPNDCSLRPMPDVNNTAPERRKTRAYIAELEAEIERLKADNARLQKQADCPYTHMKQHTCTKCGWSHE